MTYKEFQKEISKACEAGRADRDLMEHCIERGLLDAKCSTEELGRIKAAFEAGREA